MIKQRTPEWHKEREGKFTGSEIWKLFVSGRRKDEMFGQTALGYIREKARQKLTGYRRRIATYAMRRGVELEPFAIQLYEESTGNVVKETGFHKYGDNMGASPDGIIESENMGILEVKCPENPDFHDQYLMSGDLMSTEKKYYYQVQCEMLCAGLDWCHFVSYHPDLIPINLGIMLVEKDTLVWEEMVERVEKAAVLRDEHINKLLSVKTYEEKKDIQALLKVSEFSEIND